MTEHIVRDQKTNQRSEIIDGGPGGTHYHVKNGKRKCIGKTDRSLIRYLDRQGLLIIDDTTTQLENNYADSSKETTEGATSIPES